MLDEWVDEVRVALGIEEDVDVDLLLDLARDVAHAVERRAAPITTFLVGYAAGSSASGVDAVEDLARTVSALVADRG